jgi:oligopeptidase A
MRQVYLATLDLELHRGLAPGETPQQVQQRVAATNTILPPLPEDRFLCSFSHIFAGGYAAGYYSYKWAEVLSADAFAAFTEAGTDRVAEIGRRFRATVLAQGGAQHPLEVFTAFRGRAPEVGPLLRQTGLA